MKNSTGVKLVSALTGATILLAGCAPANEAAPAAAASAADALSAAIASDSSLSIAARQEETYRKLSNISGTFSFHQDDVTPADDIFNLFGTAVTALCAKPGIAFEEVSSTQDHYINVGGSVKKDYSINLSELAKQKSQTRTMVCSCATSPALASAQVTGVALADIIDMSALEEGVNTVIARSADGYGLPIPLSVALEKGAMLVYQINGKDLPASQGAPAQLWMPTAAARYFTRAVTDIELLALEEEPALSGVEERYRAKVNLINRTGDASFHPGDEITFEGYADDCGTAISAVEFSMNGGETWTAYETENAAGDRWVCWKFTFVPEAAGEYRLDVRARTEDGTVSPLSAAQCFAVTER